MIQSRSIAQNLNLASRRTGAVALALATTVLAIGCGEVDPEEPIGQLESAVICSLNTYHHDAVRTINGDQCLPGYEAPECRGGTSTVAGSDYGICGPFFVVDFPLVSGRKQFKTYWTANRPTTQATCNASRLEMYIYGYFPYLGGGWITLNQSSIPATWNPATGTCSIPTAVATEGTNGTPWSYSILRVEARAYTGTAYKNVTVSGELVP